MLRCNPGGVATRFVPTIPHDSSRQHLRTATNRAVYRSVSSTQSSFGTRNQPNSRLSEGAWVSGRKGPRHGQNKGHHTTQLCSSHPTRIRVCTCVIAYHPIPYRIPRRYQSPWLQNKNVDLIGRPLPVTATARACFVQIWAAPGKLNHIGERGATSNLSGFGTPCQHHVLTMPPHFTMLQRTNDA